MKLFQEINLIVYKINVNLFNVCHLQKSSSMLDIQGYKYLNKVFKEVNIEKELLDFCVVRRPKIVAIARCRNMKSWYAVLNLYQGIDPNRNSIHKARHPLHHQRPPHKLHPPPTIPLLSPFIQFHHGFLKSLISLDRFGI